MKRGFGFRVSVAAAACLTLSSTGLAHAQWRPGQRPGGSHWVGPGGRPPQHLTPSIPGAHHINPHVNPHINPHINPSPIPDLIPNHHHPHSIPDYVPGHVPHHVPQPPSNTIPDYTPPSHVEPTVEPEPNVLPEADVDPEPNDPFGDDVRPVTQDDLNHWKDETLKHNEQLIDQLSELTDGKLDEALAHVKDQLNHGHLDGQALADLAHQIAPLVHGDSAAQIAASKLLFRINNNARLINLLINANINININVNVNVNVFAGVGVIGWLPFFPFGQVIVLNNGVWLAGTGGCCGPYMWFDDGRYPQAVGLPYGVGPPVPESQLPPVTSGVLLINGADTSIHYQVNGQTFTMAPSYRQALPSGRAWTVSFDRGGSRGRARYRLEPGTYEFTVTDQGWDLLRQTFEANVDNRGNRFTFRYVLNNRRETLLADRTRTHRGPYPLSIRFDNGAGSTRQKSLRTATYRVALAEDGSLDLFPADAVKAPAPIADLARARDKAQGNLFAEPKKITPSLFGGATAETESVPSTPRSPATPSLFGGD